jgi:hypothetical protein
LCFYYIASRSLWMCKYKFNFFLFHPPALQAKKSATALNIRRFRYKNTHIHISTWKICSISHFTFTHTRHCYFILLYYSILQAHTSSCMILSIISIVHCQRSYRERNFLTLWIQYSARHRSQSVKLSFFRWAFILLYFSMWILLCDRNFMCHHHNLWRKAFFPTSPFLLFYFVFYSSPFALSHKVILFCVYISLCQGMRWAM